MSFETLAGVSERAALLRQELKLWEKQIADNNGGKKPGRDDIKKDATIAAKYKEYNRLRDSLATPALEQSPSTRRVLKRSTSALSLKQPQPASQTPNHRATPKKLTIHPADLDPYDAPPNAKRVLFTPSRSRKMIGPTPQKDGLVLGIFDLINTDSPSNKQSLVLGESAGNAQRTPVAPKRTKDIVEDEDLEEGVRWGRTPASSGKRFLLDSFVTPSKRKASDMFEQGTPSRSADNHGFSTPAFLRRDSQRMPNVDEEGGLTSPMMVRVPKKPPVRGLSSILAGLRQFEEDKLDEDLEMLRELEGGGREQHSEHKELDVLGQDSQAMGYTMQNNGLDENTNTQSKDDSVKSRTWKKKGAKRQTRRVIIRPVKSKPSRSLQGISEQHSEDELGVPAEDHVPETQLPDHPILSAEEDESDGGDVSDFDGSEPPGKKQKKDKEETAHIRKDENANGKSEGFAKKAVRKISQAAHANFRRLKIKSKNSKGKGGGRFGRRR